MAGTLSVTNIQGLASSATPTVVEVSSGHELHTNTLKGTTTAGSITVQGENTNTTNLQQGLAKVWIKIDGTQSAGSMPQDSFNVTSLTDNATVKTTVTIANDMANDNYSATVSGTDGDSDTTLHSLVASVFATGSVKCNAFRQTNGANDAPALNDFNLCNVCILGDLA